MPRTIFRYVQICWRDVRRHRDECTCACVSGKICLAAAAACWAIAAAGAGAGVAARPTGWNNGDASKVQFVREISAAT